MRFAWGVGIALLGLACSPSGPACTDDGDCPVTAVCANGRCAEVSFDSGVRHLRDTLPPGGDAPTCVSGTTECAGSDLRTCTGGTWSQSPCANGCDSGRCRSTGVDAGMGDAPTCVNGTTECAGSDLRTCTGGTWSQSSCANGCDATSFPAGCRSADAGGDSPACVNGSTECAGSDLRTCTGGAWASSTCTNGCDPTPPAQCAP